MSFTRYSKASQPIDIIFGNDVTDSVKAWECKGQTDSTAAITKNKTAMQQNSS